MKVLRSYWYGLGSGLILSALITVIFPLIQEQVFVSENFPTNTGIQQLAPLNPTGIEKPAEKTQPIQVNRPAQESTIPVDRPFVIPPGATAERIADLLIADGFINDKQAFLLGARRLMVESRFSAGTFYLSVGLTPEELIHRLVKK